MFSVWPERGCEAWLMPPSRMLRCDELNRWRLIGDLTELPTQQRCNQPDSMKTTAWVCRAFYQKIHLTCTEASFQFLTNYESPKYLAKSLFRITHFLFAYTIILSLLQMEKKQCSFSQTGEIHGLTGRKRIIPPTQWQPIWQNNLCMASTIFQQGEENFRWNVRPNIDHDRLTTEAIHYRAPITVPLMLAAEPPREPPFPHPLGYWVLGWLWWLWRRITVGTGEPETQGAHSLLMHHRHIHFLSPRA